MHGDTHAHPALPTREGHARAQTHTHSSSRTPADNWQRKEWHNKVEGGAARFRTTTTRSAPASSLPSPSHPVPPPPPPPLSLLAPCRAQVVPGGNLSPAMGSGGTGQGVAIAGGNVTTDRQAHQESSTHAARAPGTRAHRTQQSNNGRDPVAPANLAQEGVHAEGGGASDHLPRLAHAHDQVQQLIASAPATHTRPHRQAPHTRTPSVHLREHARTQFVRTVCAHGRLAQCAHMCQGPVPSRTPLQCATGRIQCTLTAPSKGRFESGRGRCAAARTRPAPHGSVWRRGGGGFAFTKCTVMSTHRAGSPATHATEPR
jgi:hypothetical protein